MREVSEVIDCDVLVIGGGLAGCLAAISAKETLGRDSKVVIVDKSKISRSGQSTFAAGIFTVFDPAEDDAQQWMEELVVAGEYLNDQPWCKQFFENSFRIASNIDGWGKAYGKVVFLRGEDGRFLRRRSRGHIHSSHLVINSLAMMETLRRRMVEIGVKILDRVMVTDLVGDEDGVSGALGFGYLDDRTYLLNSTSTIVSASGCGFKSVYFGHRNLTGDLQAAAFDVGARFAGMEQFYSNTGPTAYDIHGMNLYVGVGGRFLNGQGEEFMWRYHPVLGNRARLQDLTLSFCREVREGRGPIYLDITGASEADQSLCRKILPESFKLWDRAGVSPFKQKVEWAPAFKGTTAGGGGVKINLQCETNVPGLYAAGDITWIGMHGVYSFGGINIGHTAVTGDLAGRFAASRARESTGSNDVPKGKIKEMVSRRFTPLKKVRGISPEESIDLIQQAIIPYEVSYLKTPASLTRAGQRLEEIEAEVLPTISASSAHELVKAIEANSMVKVAKMMVAASLVREESRGFHHRVDFPLTDNENWLKLVVLKRNRLGGLEMRTERVETPFVEPKEARSYPPGTPVDEKKQVVS